MAMPRIIARLDVKGSNVIKGIQMDGLRVVGEVGEVAHRYYCQGADEIVILDQVASLYGRESMAGIIQSVTTNCFVPVTVGGGVRTLEDADLLFRAGADKVALNSGALERPELISEIASKYGNQAVVVHIDAKQINQGRWECYSEAGRNRTGIAVDEWICKAQNYGAGEILLSNVDRDGTRKGVDQCLVDLAFRNILVPLVVSSGVGSAQEVAHLFASAQCDGVAIGAALHWGLTSIADIKKCSASSGVRTTRAS